MAVTIDKKQMLVGIERDVWHDLLAEALFEAGFVSTLELESFGNFYQFLTFYRANDGLRLIVGLDDVATFDDTGYCELTLSEMDDDDREFYAEYLEA